MIGRKYDFPANQEGRRLMEMRQVEYFVAVVDLGSFTRAAATLGLSQPNLSRQIALLELELGHRLLVRTGRGAIPTEAGAALLAHARVMINAATRAREELDDMGNSPSGRIVVGMPTRIAHRFGLVFVQLFQKRFPRAMMSLREGMSVPMKEALINGRLDMALLFDPSPSPQLSFKELVREQLFLVAPPGQSLLGKIPAGSLCEYPLVLPAAPNSIRGLIETTLQSRQVHLRVVAEVGTQATAIALVIGGMGCTILSESAIDGNPDGHRLARAPIEPPAIWSKLMLTEPLAGASTRLTRGTAQLLAELDFKSHARVTRAARVDSQPRHRR